MKNVHAVPPAESSRLWQSGPQLLERLCFEQAGPQYTMTEVAKRIGVARGYLSDVFNGKARVSRHAESRMAGLVYSYLIGMDQ